MVVVRRFTVLKQISNELCCVWCTIDKQYLGTFGPFSSKSALGNYGTAVVSLLVALHNLHNTPPQAVLMTFVDFVD